MHESTLNSAIVSYRIVCIHSLYTAAVIRLLLRDFITERFNSLFNLCILH